MCRVNRNFEHKIYGTKYEIDSLKIYKELLQKYTLIHTNDTIGVFRHRLHHNDIIVWNVKKPYHGKNKGHGHFKSLNIATKITDDIAECRFPKNSMGIRNLESYIRIADGRYNRIEEVKNLIQVKIDKKRGNNKYHNVSICKVG